MAKVSLKNVCSRSGGDVIAVSDVSLEIEDREFVVLAGPAPSGNSTLLRMIAGLEGISRGEIFIGDRRLNDVAAPARDVGMVLATAALYPAMSVYENMAFTLRRRKFGATEIKKRVQDAAAILSLERLLEQMPGALDGEQQQRVALGRAIVRQPKVLLFDEPLVNLRGKARRLLRTEIVKLHQRLETTFVYATDNPTDALAMGDRLVVMDEGVLQQSGAASAVYRKPANLLVASFLGSPAMNLIHGTLRLERDSLLFSEKEDGTIAFRIPLAERPALRDFAGQAVVLGIRPQDLEVLQVPKGQGRTEGSFPAILDVVEPAGAETVLQLQTGAQVVACRTTQAFEAKDTGRRIQFVLDLQQVHFFDPVSTLRIV